MRNAIVVVAILAVAWAFPAAARSPGSHAHYANQGGHYAGGHGSSHKAGHYRNPRTGNHYTHHKK